MLTTKNTYSGAGFDYSNTGFVVNGDWKVEDGVLVSVNFNGIYTGKKKGRQWRQYYRLVHNFSKTYPYALQARDVVIEADRTIKEEDLKRRKKEKYINQIQNSIFDNYESLTDSHAKYAELSLEKGASITAVPYHPGAAKYFAEKGLTVPTK